MDENQAIQRDKVESGESPKCRGTGPSHIDGHELGLSIILDTKYVYLGNYETLRALVLVTSNGKEEEVQVDGDLNVYFLNNEGNELRILKQYRLMCGSAELHIPLVGEYIDGFDLGRCFRIVVTMEPSSSWGLGLGIDKRINGKAEALSGNVVPGELLQAVSEPVLQCDGKIFVTKEPEAAYYKDEGGKKNAIEIEVRVLQKQKKGGEIPLPYVPLAMKLVYSDGSLEEVQDQSILKIVPECKMFTGKDGTLKVQFRVFEVTKRHNGKQFKVCIEHYNQQGGEVVVLFPAYSSPFSVFSKRRRSGGDLLKGCVTRTDSDKSTLTALDPQPEPCLKRKPPSMPSSTLHGSPMLRSAHSIINELQWQIIGNWTSTEPNGKLVVPLFRCPTCRVAPHPYVPTDFTHDTKCSIGQWLNLYETSVSTGKVRTPVANPYLLPVNDVHQPVSFNKPPRFASCFGGCEQHDNLNGKAEASSSQACPYSPVFHDLPTGGQHHHKEPDSLNYSSIASDSVNKHSLYDFCEGL